MGTNSFGQLFTITTWGESHGPAIGVVIDGCPAGLLINEEDIKLELSRRAPGQTSYTTPRKEADCPEILSGVFEGVTTGAPISIVIRNYDSDSEKYEPIKTLYRPGHANYSYLQKYGVFDYRGGGRASARETACRVAAGAVAKLLLKHYNIEVVAYLEQVMDVRSNLDSAFVKKERVLASPIFCPDKSIEQEMMDVIELTKNKGDSVGGVVCFIAREVPPGLGDPIYEKMEANLAKAMMSIPASKGFEIGSGFSAASMYGSEHNDVFVLNDGLIQTEKNNAGGVLGGVSSGMTIYGRVAFKPTSSIKKDQKTVNTDNEEALFSLPEGSRHDPCVAIRAVPVVEAMLAIVLADSLLMNRVSRL